jgi:hypothetical protein
LVTARLTTSSRGTGRLKAHLALDDTFTLGRCTMVTQQTTVVGNPFRPIPTMDHPCFEQGRGTSVREPTARGCHVGHAPSFFFFFFFFFDTTQENSIGQNVQIKHNWLASSSQGKMADQHLRAGLQLPQGSPVNKYTSAPTRGVHCEWTTKFDIQRFLLEPGKGTTGLLTHGKVP